MKQVAEKIIEILDGSTELSALVGSDFYWGLAPAEVEPPFVVFGLDENQEASKDRRGDYTINTQVYSESMDNASDIDQAVRNALILAGAHNRGAQSGYSDPEATLGLITRNFNLKITL